MNENKFRNIYLVRHCKPKFMDDIILCIGKKDIPLSSEGMRHAKLLAKYFSSKNIDNIYASPLKRAKETAEIIADSRTDIILKESFSEIDIGKWDGISFDEIKLRYPEEYEARGKDLENYIVEGGESMAMCRERAAKGLNSSIEESKGNILIVTHAGIIRSIISYVMAINIKDTFTYKIDYGSISTININGNTLNFEEIGLQIKES